MILSALALISCKKNSTSAEELNELEGVWKYDNTEGDDIYLEMGSETITIFDYYGDDFDQGEDCYYIDVYEITNVEGSTFTIIYSEEPDMEFEITIEFVNEKIRITQTFEFNGEEETFTEFYSRSNREVSSFTPECSDEEFKVSNSSIRKVRKLF